MDGKPPEFGKEGWFTYKDYLTLGPAVMIFGFMGAFALPFILFSLVSKYPYMVSTGSTCSGCFRIQGALQ